MSSQIIAGTLVSKAAEHGHQFEILAKPMPVPELLDSAARLLAPPSGTGLI
jgi:hypothetical protein